MSEKRFRVNSPPVVQETIEGEVMLVNLDSGSYYSMDNVAARVWALMEEGASVAECAAALADEYETAATVLEEAVRELFGQFEREGLVVARTDGVRYAGKGTAAGTRKAFTVPVLNKYNDMQDILVLDPVHEVDESGWPKADTTANVKADAPR